MNKNMTTVNADFEFTMIFVGTILSFSGIASIITKCAIAGHKAKKAQVTK